MILSGFAGSLPAKVIINFGLPDCSLVSYDIIKCTSVLGCPNYGVHFDSTLHFF